MVAIMRYRTHLTQRRATLIMELGQIEEFLGMERSITPRRDRKGSKA
jgi:hypothetical protein